MLLVVVLLPEELEPLLLGHEHLLLGVDLSLLPLRHLLQLAWAQVAEMGQVRGRGRGCSVVGVTPGGGGVGVPLHLLLRLLLTVVATVRYSGGRQLPHRRIIRGTGIVVRGRVEELLRRGLGRGRLRPVVGA